MIECEKKKLQIQIRRIYILNFLLQDTFMRATTWVKELQRQASPSIVIALAGNKADLGNKRVVEFEEAQAYADENGLLFMETSAKTAMNVNDIFLAIGKEFFSLHYSNFISNILQKRRAITEVVSILLLIESCNIVNRFCSIINFFSAHFCTN